MMLKSVKIPEICLFIPTAKAKLLLTDPKLVELRSQFCGVFSGLGNDSDLQSNRCAIA